jgi:uncharacterized protein with PIN domain
MLGKLAKWLKILGFDTVYLNKAEDRDLLLIARRQHRVLLSKDQRLIEAAKNVRTLFIESDDWPEQLRQVLVTCALADSVRPHSRCLACNVELRQIPKKAAKNLVTPFVLEKGSSFAVCPSCERVYWPGTHFHSMDTKIREILRKPGIRKQVKHKDRAGPGRPSKKA